MATTKDIALILSFTDKGTPVVKKAVAATKAELAKLTKEAERTGKGFKTMKGQAEKSSSSMGGFKKMIKSTAAQMAMGMGVMMGVQGAMRLVKGAITSVIDEGRAFEKSWANVTTMLSISGKETERLKWNLIGLSPTLGDTTELAKGMYQVLSASIEPSKAIMFLGEAAKSAQAGVTEIATAVDALTTVINAYGMQAEDVTKVSDIMFQTVKRGKLTYEGMSGALGTVVPIAAQVGVSFEEISAAMATMTRQGIDVNTTTMQLRQIMVAILKPTTDAAKMAVKLGIDFSAAGLKAKGLAVFLKEVQEKAGDDAEALTALFGNVRSLSGVMALGGKAAAGFAKDMGLMTDAAGSTEEAFTKQMDSMDFWLDVIKNSVDKMKISFYQGFVDPFKEGISSSEDLEDRVAMLTIRMYELGDALGKVVSILSKVFGFLADAAAKGGAVGAMAQKLTDLTMGIVGVKGPTDALREAQLKLMKQTEGNTESMGDLEESIHGSGVVSALEDLLGIGEDVEGMLEKGLGTVLALANMKLLEKGIIDIGTALQEEMGKALHELDLDMVSFGMSLSSNTIAAIERLSKESGVAADVLEDRLIKQFENLIKEAKKTKALEDALKYLDDFKEGAKSLGVTLDKDLRNKLEEVTDYITKFRAKLSPRELEQLAKKAVALANKLDKELSPAILRLADKMYDVKKAASEVEVLTGGLAQGMTKLQENTNKAGVLIGGVFAPALYKAIGGLKKAYDAAKKYSLVFKTDVRKELTETIKTYKMFTDETWKGAELTKGSQLELVNTIVELHKKLGIDVPDEWKKMQKKLEDITKETAENINKRFSTAFTGLSGIFRTLSDNYEGAMGDLLSATGSAFDALGTMFAGLEEGAKASFTDIAKAVGPMLGSIGGAIGQMISGAEKSFAGLGASLGGMVGSIFGPIGKAVGSLLGGLVGGLFKKKEKKTEEQRLAEQFTNQVQEAKNAMKAFGEITDATAEKIAESRKTMGGAAATAKHFADVIRDVGVTQENVNKLWIGMVDIMNKVESGELSVAEGAVALGDSFELLIEGARRLGTEGSAAMVEMIQKFRETGIEVQAVTDYINEQLGIVKQSGMSAAEGLEAMALAIPDDLSALKELGKNIMAVEDVADILGSAFVDALRSAQEFGTEGSKAMTDYIRAIKESGVEIQALTDYIDKQLGVVRQSGMSAAQGLEAMAKAIDWTPGIQSLEILERQTVAVFNAMIENGASYFEAMQSMGGVFDALIAKHEEMGTTGGAAIQELLKLREVVKANEDLFNAIEGNLGVLNALANTGSLNQQVLSDAATQATNYYNALINAGLSGNQALSSMAPTLERLRFLAEEHGLEIDAATQGLINQAEQQGLLGDQTASVTDIMLAGFGELIKVLGGDIPAAFQAAMDNVAAMGNATDEAVETTTENAAAQLGILERQTLAVFNAMIANGATYAEAMTSIGPTLDILADKYKEWGLEGSAAIQELLKLREVTEANQELFNAIEGNLAVMDALANTGSLTQEILTDAASAAGTYYNQLLEAGLSGNQALSSMAPTLERLRFLAEEHGLALDDATLALIRQAEEAGLLKEQELSMQETMMAGFGLMLQAMGVDMPAAFQRAIDKMGDMEAAMAGSGVKSATEQVQTAAENLGTAFNTTFDDAKMKAIATAGTIQGEIGAIKPIVDINFDYEVPDFNYKGSVDLDFEADPERWGNIMSGYFKRNPITVATDFSGGGISAQKGFYGTVPVPTDIRVHPREDIRITPWDQPRRERSDMGDKETKALLQELIATVAESGGNVQIEPVVIPLSDAMEQFIIRFLPKATEHEKVLIHQRAVKDRV